MTATVAQVVAELRGSVLSAYRGSIAHGMYTPSSDRDSIDDKDVMSFVVPGVDCYLGLKQYGSRGTVEIKRDEIDAVAYELRKAVSLLLGGNPNVLSMLWVPEGYVIQQTDIGREMRKRRDLFVGRHVYKPFVGYATQQLYKMEHGAHLGYMGEKRKTLVERYGYDTKNASHLIRLLRMGIEFLRDGNLIVDRGGYDATELLAIKHGEWSLERVKTAADRLFKRAEDVYDRSTLPVGPERSQVEDLCVIWVRETLRERGAI